MSPAEITALMKATAGTPTERCIALLVASGVTSTKDIAEALGVTLRAVQKARQRTTGRAPRFASELQDANPSSQANYSSPKSEPQFVSQPTETRARATKELPSEVVIDSKPFFEPTPFDLRVRLENGIIVLCPEVRAKWVAEFGDEKDLDLALLTAANYVQPNSMRPLEAQVSGQLARVVRERREKDKRYAAAAAAAAAASKPAKQQAQQPTYRATSRPSKLTREQYEKYEAMGLV